MTDATSVSPALDMPRGDRPAEWARLLRLLGAEWAAERDALQRWSQTDWDQLLALADRHWVTPYLHRRFTAGAPGTALADVLPKTVRVEFRKRYLRATFRHLRSVARIAPFLSACRAAGIDVVVLKGMHLGPLVYGHPAERPMMDIDLLARKNDLAHAVRILCACGFRQFKSNRSEPAVHSRSAAAIQISGETHELPPFVHPAHVKVDLHYALVPENRKVSIDYDALIDRATPLRIGGADTLALAPEDLLLHLCLHIACLDLFSVKLLSLIDVPKVVDYHRDQLDWATFRERAHAWGATRPVLITFALAERLFGWQAPQGALNGLGSLPDDRDLLALTERLVFLRGQRQRAAEFRRVDNIARAWTGGISAGKAKTLLGRLFPTRRDLAARYSLRSDSPFVLLYYLWNLACVLVRLTPYVMRTVRRDPAMLMLLEAGAARNQVADWLAGR